MATYSAIVSQPGAYILWGRVIAPSDRNNSFFIQAENGADHWWEIKPGKKWHRDKASAFKNMLDPVTFYFVIGYPYDPGSNT
jgi:hypothetical protein